jgi:hypothetical protein
MKVCNLKDSFIIIDDRFDLEFENMMGIVY